MGYLSVARTSKSKWCKWEVFAASTGHGRQEREWERRSSFSRAELRGEAGALTISHERFIIVNTHISLVVNVE